MIKVEKYNETAYSRYYEFVFRKQFRRKISPVLFILSDVAFKIIVGSIILYLFYPNKTNLIVMGSMSILTYKYIKTRMRFSAKLIEWKPGKDDESLRVLSWWNRKKEQYLKNKLIIQRGENY